MTYSFAYINFIINCPSYGQKSVNGLAIGDAAVTMQDNLTETDLANDGTVMPSRIESKRGNITLQIQQTSSLNNWLLGWVNKLKNSSPSVWASTYITIKENFSNGRAVTAKGVCPLKFPDHKDAQTG